MMIGDASLTFHESELAHGLKAVLGGTVPQEMAGDAGSGTEFVSRTGSSFTFGSLEALAFECVVDVYE